MNIPAKKSRNLSALIVAVSIAVGGDCFAQDGSFTSAPDPATRAIQQQVYSVVHDYERALDRGDTAAILDLFEESGVAEWNGKRTYATRQQKADGYDALFKAAKFSTVFSYDSIDVIGEAALVRTHHHKGATVMESGKNVPDLNREVFVLRKVEGSWKIVLYTFNTDPVQGEG